MKLSRCILGLILVLAFNFGHLGDARPVTSRHVASLKKPARFVLPRESNHQKTVVFIEIAASNFGFEVPQVVARILGKEAHLHKLRICVSSPDLWGFEGSASCAEQSSRTKYELNLMSHVENHCDFADIMQAGQQR